MKNILSLLLAVVMISTFEPYASFAAEKPLESSFRYKNGVLVAEEGKISDDAQLMSLTSGELQGIDVSSHQGEINWEAVQSNGIDFAIIRCGYGDDLPQYDDYYWKRNADECTRLGIPFGVYLYSYAASIGEAQSEAAHVMRLIKDYDLTLPVYLDLENTNTVGACSNELIGEMAEIFCTTLQNKGYEVGIYANLNWWNNRLTSDVFKNPSWHKWIAQWGSSCEYDGEYTMWQYSDSGYVEGISGKVDMDIWYGALPLKKTVGDINGDGNIDAGDAGLILRYDAGLQNLTAGQLGNGDMNGDGIVDSGDAGIILRTDAGM